VIPFRILSAGDSALLVEFEAKIDPAINAHAIAVASSVDRAAIGGVRDIVPTYRSVAIYFDPLRTDIQVLRETVERESRRRFEERAGTADAVRVPVCYGGDYGPDLDETASLKGISPEQLVEIHVGTVYTVFMLGFLPGFAYMGVLDDRIAAPRRRTPRTQVPKGSVGIAGRQTGVYPSNAPGGWQVIGRTPLDPFDLARPSPFLFKAGDRVQFVRITSAEFDAARADGSSTPRA
jgi:inhibitor of KinA